MLLSMAIYFGHTTAQRILESRLVRELEVTNVRGPINCISNKEDVLVLIHREFGGEAGALSDESLFLRANEPIDLVVSCQEDRRKWKGARFHVMSERIPPHSFRILRADILVACPELCFLQRASELTLIETICLAMSFCGIYRLNGDAPDGSSGSTTIFDRHPIMTVDSALRYLKDLDGFPGVEKARRALSYALPYSGSPKETQMVIPFYLPRKYGGFGLPRPSMNRELPLTDHARKIIGKERCFGDAVWESGVKDDPRCFDLEFQSKEHHDNEQSYGDDFGRQIGLEAAGHTVQFVANAQLSNIEQMTELARRIAAFTHTKLPENAFEKTPKRIELLHELASSI